LNLLKPFLAECLKKLNPKTQAALRLKFSKKISNEQIGYLVGGSKSYIGRLLNKGLKALRKCIENRVRKSAQGSTREERWSSVPTPTVNLSSIEKLLAQCGQWANHGCEASEQMMSALKNAEDIDAREWAVAHLARCEECRETLFLLQALSHISEVPKPISLEKVRQKRAKTIPWKTIAAAVALVLGAAVLFGWIHKRQEHPYPGEGLSIKGSADTLHVAVQRGSYASIVKPLDQLMTEDKLGFFYSAEEAGYLAIFSRDSSGNVALLYPAGDVSSASILKGHKVPLTDGAIVGEGVGCEWLIAVFSEKAMNIDILKQTLAKAENMDDADACRLDVMIPQARSVRVFPVKR
jgi:hypothetical protein